VNNCDDLSRASEVLCDLENPVHLHTMEQMNNYIHKHRISGKVIPTKDRFNTCNMMLKGQALCTLWYNYGSISQVTKNNAELCNMIGFANVPFSKGKRKGVNLARGECYVMPATVKIPAYTAQAIRYITSREALLAIMRKGNFVMSSGRMDVDGVLGKELPYLENVRQITDNSILIWNVLFEREVTKTIGACLLDVLSGKASYENALTTIRSKVNSTKRSDYYASAVKNAKAYMELKHKEAISVKDVANSVNLSAGYFEKIFKDNTKMTLANYITKIRVEKAGQLLIENTGCNISQIAEKVGYPSVYYFSRVFKKHTGLTPTQYRYQKI